MKCKLVIDVVRDPGGPTPAGTIITHPKAYVLVRMGVAVPADDHCEKRAGLTPEQMTDAQSRHRRVASGGILEGVGHGVPAQEADDDADWYDPDEPAEPARLDYLDGSGGRPDDQLLDKDAEGAD